MTVPAHACVSVANATARAVRRARFVGAHQLAEDQSELASLFGEQSGRIVDRFDLGDHTGLLLEPVGGGRRRDARPLMFRQVDHFDAGHPA